VEGKIEGVAQLSVVESIKLAAAVLAVTDYLLSLTHQTHIQLDQRLILIEFQLIQFQLFLLHHHHQNQHLLQFYELFHLHLQRLCLIRRQICPEKLRNHDRVTYLVLRGKSIHKLFFELKHISVRHEHSAINGEQITESVLVNTAKYHLTLLIKLSFQQVFALEHTLFHLFLEDRAVLVQPFVEVSAEGSLRWVSLIEPVVHFDLIGGILAEDIVGGRKDKIAQIFVLVSS